MKARNEKGSMIALSAICAFVLTLIGLGFYFVMRLIGGSGEIQHATDAGNLDIARQALVATPNVSPVLKPVPGVLDPFIVSHNFGPLLLEDKGNVSLKNYNRVAGQALIVSANASQFGQMTPLASLHVGDLVKAVQGKDGSIGAQLSQTLTSNEGSVNPLFRKKVFKNTANSNTVRMLDDGKGVNPIAEEASSYDTSQVIPSNDKAYGLTNIEVTPPLRLQLQGLLNDKIVKKGSSYSDKYYLAGYTRLDVPINSAHNVGSIVGVCVQPEEQPHGISGVDFEKGKSTKSQLGPNTTVPPNAFRSMATTKADVVNNQQNNPKNLLDVMAKSQALVGSLKETYPLAIPYGYIKITNDAGSSSPGMYNNLDTILANELVTPPGIIVSGNFFTTNQALLFAWRAYKLSLATGTPLPMPPAPQMPASLAIFNLQTGRPATQQQLLTGLPLVDTARCTDRNTLTPSPNPTCFNNAEAFQRAYYPWTNGEFGSKTFRNPTNLMAVECMKCQLQAGFPMASGKNVYAPLCKETGLRLFNPTQLVTNSFGKCQVSRPGTIRELGNQVRSGFGDLMVLKILERAAQISAPRTTVEALALSAFVTNLLDSQTLDLGETKYLYLANPGSVGRGMPRIFVLSSQPPVWMVPTLPDGKAIPGIHTQFNTYEVVNNRGSVSPTVPTSYAPFINTNHDGGIHDVPYTGGPDELPGIQATDIATFQPSSGYNNLLGVVSFKNRVMGVASNFNSPN